MGGTQSPPSRKEKKSKKDKHHKHRHSDRERRASHSRSRSPRSRSRSPHDRRKRSASPPAAAPPPAPPPAPSAPAADDAPVKAPERKRRRWDAPADPPAVATAAAGGTEQNAAVAAALSRLNAAHSSGTLSAAGGAALNPLQTLLSTNTMMPPTATAAAGGRATVPITRRLYVDNLPLGTTDAGLLAHLNGAFKAKGIQAAAAPPIANCRVDKLKGYAMLELCTAEEATMALGMDGIRFYDQVLKIRRPRDFGVRDAKAADESARRSKRLDVVSHKVKHGPHTVLLGNVPSSLPPAMVRELVTSFGSLRSFRAGRDGDGTCTFEYDANEDAAAAAPGLHGLKVAGAVLAAAVGEHAAATLAPLLAPPTPVLRVQGVVSLAALNKGEESGGELAAVEAELREQCEQWGAVVSSHVPRVPPWARAAVAALGTATGAGTAATAAAVATAAAAAAGKGEDVSAMATAEALGSVFVEMASAESAQAVAMALHGRSITAEEGGGGESHKLSVAFVPLERYRADWGVGLPPTTTEAKRQAAMAAHEKLQTLLGVP